MLEHPDEVLIDAYVEDLLPADERASVDAHLAACAPCADEVARQRALLDSLRALPRSIDPDADLRPAIRAALREHDAADARRRWMRSLRVPLAAAAVLLVAVTAGVTALLVADPDAQPRAALRAAESSRDVLLADFDRSRADYLRTAQGLTALLERHRARLAPETVELVERNLGTIDQALREADEALRADPSSPVVREMILATEEKKVEVLRWANSLVRT